MSEEIECYWVRSNWPAVWPRAATTAGTTANRLATTKTPTAKTAISATGTVATGTAPRLVANAFHTTWPRATPKGTPTTIPTSATVVACQHTAAPTWLFTSPSPLRSPISRRRRATLTTRRWSNVAAPNNAKTKPRIKGKLTASPKLTNDVGTVGRLAFSPW